MQDAGLDALRMCNAVLMVIPDDCDAHGADAKIIDIIAKVAAGGYGMKSKVVTNSAADMLTAAAIIFIGRERYRLDALLSKLFFYLTVFLPYAVKVEAESPSLIPSSFPPYSPANDHSVAHILQAATKLIREFDPEYPYIDRFARFADVAEALVRHLKEVAQSVTFGNSFVLTDLTMALSEIFRICRWALGEVEPPPSHKEADTVVGIIRNFIWAAGAFWLDGKPNTDAGKADEMARILVAHSIVFIRLGHDEIAFTTARTIKAMAEALARRAQVNVYVVARVLAQLWPLRLAGDLASPQLAAFVDGLLVVPPGLVGGEVARLVAEHRERVEEELGELRRWGTVPPDPIEELRALSAALREKGRAGHGTRKS